MSESSSDGPLLGLASAGDPGERPAEMKDELIAFLANPKAYDYAAVSVNLCKVYRADKLSDQEREIAENILRKLSKSMEASIRQSLSEHLKQCRLLPHDVASTLAHDVETVALPMIRFSQVLSDEDLVAIVRAKGEAHQVAVAGRKTLSEAVSQAVIEAGNEEPVRTLLSNQGAAISDSGYGKVIEDFSTSEAVTEAMAARPDLPQFITEKLIAVVSEHLRFALISRHATSADLVERLIQQGSEGALVARISQCDGLDDVQALTDQLYPLRRLTPTLLLRAIYYGQLDFFEIALARLAQMSVREARAQIHSPKPEAFQFVYQRAQLDARLFLAFADALKRLAKEIVALAESGGSSRRIVGDLIHREDFDKQQFESALLVAGARL